MRIIYLRVLLAKLVKRTEGERRLHDYALYVKIYREKKAEGLDDEEAADAAVDEAIRLNLLDGFFKVHKAEVGKMILCEFDQEEYDDMRREEGREAATAEMQPIIDQQAAEIARQVAENEALRAKIAELEALQPA